MTQNTSSEDAYTRLRLQAEKILKAQKGGRLEQAGDDLLRTIHELEAHQIKLKLQNKELRQTAHNFESAREEYFRFFDSAPVGFATADKTNIIQRINSTALRMLKYTGCRLTGQKFSLLVWPDDLSAFLEGMKSVADTGSTDAQESVELRLLRKDGLPLYVRLMISAGYDENNSFSHWQFAVVDISESKQVEEELKQKERRFRALTEKTSEFIVILDEKLKISYSVLGSANRLLYATDELVGRDALKLVHPNDRSDALTKLQEVLQHPNGARNAALRIRAKSGAWRWMYITGTNLLHDPAINGVVVNGRDDTERKRMEEELKRSRDRLELRVQERTKELSHAVGSLRERTKQLGHLTAELIKAEQNERQRLARILHDGLQQMLVGAIFQIDIFEQEHRLPDELIQLREILDQASETSRLLATELSPPILWRRDLCAALRWLVGWMGKTHGLTVELKIPEEIPELANEVFLLLFQSARELLFNVVKHAGVRKAWVELDRKDGWILLTVKDKGKGFMADKLRLEGGKAGGFGLFSMRERLSLMGGRLEIDSIPGRGSLIRLIFPISHVTTPSSGTSAMKQAAVAEVNFPGDEPRQADREMKIRIMLVDDHEVVRQGVANLIRREPGLEIVGEASEGKSAVDMVREVQPDVVLMDINMPAMNGIQATQLIHNEFPDIRIIGFSIYDEEQQKEAMLEAGATAYFCKRRSSRDLIETIRTCI